MKVLPFIVHREKNVKRVMVLVNLALLIFLARAAADLTWKIRREMGPATTVVDVIAAKKGAGPVKNQDLPGAAAMLFGPAAEKIVALPKELPPTPLALVLKGTVVPSTGTPYAIVAAKKGGDELVVSPGDTLSGGARVERVFPDRIEILRNGRHEVLQVESDDHAGAAKTSAGEGNAWRVESSYRKRWLSDLPTLGRKVRAQPVKDKNGRVGFRLLSSDRNILKTVGLQSGDVVYEVNGIPLSNPAQALKAAGELMKSKEVTVSFGRNGQVMSRVYRMEE